MRRTTRVTATALTLVAVAAPSAGATDLVFGPLQRVSPGDSLSLYGAGVTSSGPTCAPGQSGTNYPGAEVEPWVAFHGSYGVASWQQDRWDNGGSNGLPVAITDNGGVTWTVPDDQPKFTCAAAGTPPNSRTGGTVFERASDPWTAISSDGSTAYAMGLVFDGTDFINGMEVSTRSVDGGQWSTPKLLIRDTSATVLDDKNSITTDPGIAANAYAIWDRLVFPSGRASPTAAENALGFRGPIWFSKTSDFGANWSKARMLYDPGEVNQTIGNQIVVLGDGTLVDGFDLIYNFKNAHKVRGSHVATLTSTDHGNTWSTKPTIVAPLQSVGVPNVRTGDINPEIAADPRPGSTTFYFVWQDASFVNNRYEQIAMAKCDGAGGQVSCDPPQRVNHDNGEPAFTPNVRVRSDGALAITYYQFTGNSDKPYETETNVYHRDAGGTQTWQTIDGGTFDMGQAANAEGLFVGDYEGLGEAAGSLIPFFAGTDGQQKSSACSTSSGADGQGPPCTFTG